jgi:uroporphyrin-III C-methyltransferase
MNDEVASKEIETSEKAGETAKPKKSFSWILVILFLVSVGLVVIVYLQVDKLKQNSGVLSASLAPIQLKLASMESELVESARNNRQLTSELNQLAQQQHLLSTNQEALFKRQPSDNSDWTLAEVEHLLIVAIHRIQLESNVPLALAAMQAADDRLKTNINPRLLSVRKQLRRDMNTLEAVEDVDISGLVLYLSDLVSRVGELPLKQVRVNETISSDENTGTAQNNRLEELLASIWVEIKGLVVISREGEEALATLMPEQEYFLYQNLRLQLEAARFSVLRRDTESLHTSVEIANKWLSGYFKSSDKRTANLIESLSRMAVLELNPDLPDISSSLESLRAYLKSEDISSDLNLPQQTEPEQ